MRYRFDGFNYVVRLEKDDLLVRCLTELASEFEDKSVWAQGLGAAQWAELGFYDLATKEYRWRRFDQPTEITSLQGNLAWIEGKPVWHLHATLSDAKFQAVGGHVKELLVAGTCELLLHTIDGEPLARRDDPETGLQLLAI